MFEHVSYVVHLQEDMRNFRQKLVAILFTSKYVVPNRLPVLEISPTICDPSDKEVEVSREQFISRESPLDSVHSTVVEDSTMQPQTLDVSVNKRKRSPLTNVDEQDSTKNPQTLLDAAADVTPTDEMVIIIPPLSIYYVLVQCSNTIPINHLRL